VPRGWIIVQHAVDNRGTLRARVPNHIASGEGSFVEKGLHHRNDGLGASYLVGCRV